MDSFLRDFPLITHVVLINCISPGLIVASVLHSNFILCSMSGPHTFYNLSIPMVRVRGATGGANRAAAENMITDGEEDHYLEEFFPKPVPYHLLPLIEHRIKLLCKSDVIINAGEIQVINTSCIIREKSRKNSAKTLQKLSMYMLPYESLPLSFESSGYIDQKFTGRLMVKVGNFTHKKIQLSAGTPVAYIALASYSIE